MGWKAKWSKTVGSVLWNLCQSSGYRPAFQGRSAANNKEVKPDEADKSSVASRLNGGAVRFGDK